MPTFAELTNMWNAHEFEPQIHHIRFPHFRNLEEGLRIDFSCPITAIVGANGTNKSSILRAIQGCPDYENIGKYWFGTAIDVIEPEDRHRFIYGRWSDSAASVVEVIKTRIRRSRTRPATGTTVDPDSFEPSRPLKTDGMSPMPPLSGPIPADRVATRWKAIDKQVVYLDFRAEISAFDKYFYHNDFRARRPRGARRDPLSERKELIRERSKRLKVILDRRETTYRPGGKEWIVEAPHSLPQREVDAMGRILGRVYSSVEVVRHTAFDVVGTTALLQTSDFSYSEAWAGSGEFAVLQLVMGISNAPQRALVLLDEPEVSLHPGAQRRLIQYLQQEASDKRLQIVLATHSPAMIETLPPDAIKVLEVAPSTHRVAIRSQRSSPTEAFVAIEHSFRKKTVVVEDALAQEIVLRALRGDQGLFQTVEVFFQPGGATSLRTKYLPVWASESNNNVLLYLDGDQQISPAIPNESSISPERLRTEVRRLMGTTHIDRYIASNTGGITEPQLRQILSWYDAHVRYLPGGSPDDWLRRQVDQEAAGDSKQWWRSRTFDMMGKTASEDVSSGEILSMQKLRLAEVQVDNQGLSEVRDQIRQFVERSQ